MKKELTINVSMSQLLYDIENKLHLIGISRESGNTPEGVEHIQADDLPASRNQLLRSIQEAIGTVYHSLHEYVTDIDTDQAGNALPGESDYSVRLLVPANYNTQMVKPLADLIHQYVVNTVLMDWLLITDKPDAAEYATSAATNLKQIDSILCKRVRPSRPIYSNNE